MIPSYRDPDHRQFYPQEAEKSPPKETIVSNLLLAIGLVALAIFASLSACTPGEKQAAKDALDVLQVACVVANQALPDTAVAAACGVADPLLGPMQQILASSRAASAQAVTGARACSSAVGSVDAGAVAPSSSAKPGK